MSSRAVAAASAAAPASPAASATGFPELPALPSPDVHVLPSGDGDSMELETVLGQEPNIPPQGDNGAGVGDEDEAQPPPATPPPAEQGQREAAVEWGDRGEIFTPSVVAKIANRLDHKNKKTRLNDKQSLWGALCSPTVNLPGLDGVSKKSKDTRIPTHVVAAPSWASAISNAATYALASEEEQKQERDKYNASSQSEKKRFGRKITRLHKETNRPSLSGNQQQRNENAGGGRTAARQPGVPTRMSNRRIAAMEDAARAAASDPERIERVRQEVGYVPPPPEDTSERAQRRRAREQQGETEEEAEYTGRGSNAADRNALADGQRRPKQQTYRALGVPPKTIGEQSDSSARKAFKHALRNMAIAISTVHLPKQDRVDGGGDGDDGSAAGSQSGEEENDVDHPLCSYLFLALDEVVVQTNLAGGALRHEAARVPRLISLGYDDDTCNKILAMAFEQHSRREEGDPPPPPCIKEHIVKEEGKTLLETVDAYLAKKKRDQERDQPTRANETNANVQRNHITPRAREDSQASPAYSVGETPHSVRVAMNEEQTGIEVQRAANNNNDDESWMNIDSD